MKVLFLSTWFPYPPDNGSKLRVFHLLQALGRRHDLTLCSFAFDTARPGDPGPLTTLCKEIVAVHRDPFERSAAARALRFLSPSPIVDAPLPEMQARVADLWVGNRFDAVIASTTVTATYALQAGRALKVLEEHNCHSRWAWERYQRQALPVSRFQAWVSWWKRRRYDARLYRCFDLCTMVSEEDRAASLHLVRDHPTRIEVVPNGVDCDHNYPGLAQPVPNALIFSGALTYSANYDAMRYFLSEIYPRIRREEPAVSLTITGSTADVNLSALPLDRSVHLSGYVADVRPLVAAASVCVVPIRQGGGTRLKILEAMALGTPVVATAKGAEGLDVTPEEHILIADDPAEFAGQVLRLLRESSLRTCLAANARHLVEQHYDWRAIGQRFVALVETTAGDWNLS